MSNNSQSNTFHRHRSNSRLVEELLLGTDLQQVHSSSTSGLLNHSSASTPTQCSLVKIIDVQKRPQRGDSHQQEVATNLDSAIPPESRRNDYLEQGNSPSSSQQQQQQFVVQSADQQRWTPSGKEKSDTQQEQQKQQSGETLSSFESDYDLLVYLGETETEDLVDTERSLDYQDQTWRQSICGGASLAPTIDESLSELATPIGYQVSTGSYKKPTQSTTTTKDECDLLFAPSPMNSTTPSFNKRQGNQNIQAPRSQAHSSGPGRSVSRVSKQQQLPAQLDSDAECDHEVSLVFKANQQQHQQDTTRARQAAFEGTANRQTQSLSRGQQSKQDNRQVLEQPQKLTNIGNKIASLFNRKASPPIQRPERASPNTLHQPIQQVGISELNKSYAKMEGDRSTGSQMYRPELRQQQSLDGRRGKDEIGETVSEASELDRLLAEMSQSLDLNSLARYDPNPNALNNRNNRKSSEQSRKSQTLSKFHTSGCQIIDDSRSEGQKQNNNPSQTSAQLESSRSLSRTLQGTNINPDPLRSRSELATSKTLVELPNTRLNQQQQQQASSESILDEYDGASRMLEQIISDQLEESAARRLQMNNQKQDSYYSSQSMESRESPSVLLVKKRFEITANNKNTESPLTIGSTSGQSIVEQQQQQSRRKLSDCSSTVTTDPSMILTSRIGDLPSNKREHFESRSVWRHRRSATKGSSRKPFSQTSLDQTSSINNNKILNDNEKLKVKSTRSLVELNANTVSNEQKELEDLSSSRVCKQNLELQQDDIATSCRLEQQTPTTSESRPPSLPDKDYSDHLSVIRVEAADFPSSSSDDEQQQQQPDANSEGHMSRMKRRTLSGMRSMRDKLIGGFRGGQQLEDTTTSNKKEEGSISNVKPPRPPKRSSSSINSRELTRSSSLKRQTPDNDNDNVNEQKQQQQQRESRRDTMANRRQQSFGQQIKERLSRSKSRLSKFLKPSAVKSRAQSSPNTKQQLEMTDDNKLFQPSDIARNSEEPRTVGIRSDNSFGESLDRHLAADLDKRATPLKGSLKRSSSSSSSLSGLDIAKKQSQQRSNRAKTNKDKTKERRSSSLISLKRLSLLKSKQPLEPIDLDAMKVSTTSNLPQVRNGNSKGGRRRRKRNNNNKSVLNNNTDSNESSRASPLIGAKLATTNDYFGQVAPAKTSESPIQNDNSHQIKFHRQLATPEFDDKTTLVVADLQRSARSLNLALDNKSQVAAKKPIRSQSMRSISRHEPAIKQTKSLSNYNRRLPTQTNTFRLVSAECDELQVEKSNLLLEQPIGTPTREAVTPIGFGQTSSSSPLMLNVEGKHHLKIPSGSSSSKNGGRNVSPIRAKSAAMLDDIRNKCSDLFLRSSPAARRKGSNDDDSNPPVRPPRRRNAPRRSKSMAARAPLNSEMIFVEARPVVSLQTTSEHPVVVSSNKERFVNLAQQLKHSAKDFFNPSSQNAAAATSGHRRARSSQRATNTMTTPTTTTSNDSDLCQWKPVIKRTTTPTTGRFGSTALKDLVKDKEQTNEDHRTRPTLHETESNRPYTTDRQQSLESTDSTWESSNEEIDSHHNHIRTINFVQANESSLAGFMQADETVDLQPARDIMAPDKLAAACLPVTNKQASSTNAIGTGNADVSSRKQQVAPVSSSSFQQVNKKKEEENKNKSEQAKQIQEEPIETNGRLISSSVNKSSSSIEDNQMIAHDPLIDIVESSRFRFNADLPSPAQVLFNSSFGKRKQQDANTEIERENLTILTRGEPKQQVVANDRIGSLEASQQEAKTAMVAVAKSHPKQQVATDETQQYLGAKSGLDSSSSSRLNEELIESQEEEKRLSVYENMEPLVRTQSELVEQSLVGISDNIDRITGGRGVRNWRKSPTFEEDKSQEKNTQDNKKKKEVVSVVGSDECVAANGWSLDENNDYRLNNLRNVENVLLQKQLKDQKDLSSSEILKRGKEEQSAISEQAPAKPKRKLVTRTSIIHDPNDELMRLQVCSIARPTTTTPIEEVQCIEPRGSNKSQLTRQDSTFSSLGQDNENNSDSDSSFACAATSRQRLLSKFEQQQAESKQQRPKFPAFNEGKAASQGSTGGGSLVKRLARNFDQAVNAQEPSVLATQANRGKPPLPSKQVVTTTRITQSPLRLVEADESRSESTWYDAKSSEVLDEAEVAEFLLELERDERINSPRLSEPTSVSTGLEPFVTVAESTLEEDDNGLRCSKTEDNDNQQTGAIDVTLDDDDTLNDDDDVQLGEEFDQVHDVSYRSSMANDDENNNNNKGKNDSDDDNNRNNLQQPVSCSESDKQQPVSDNCHRHRRRREMRNNEKLAKAAKKCSRLYDELEKILAHRAAKEELRLKQQSTSGSLGEDNNAITEDGFCEDDDFIGEESTSSTIYSERDDQISLSSSSMSSESIPEVIQRQNLQKLYHIVNEIYSSEAKFVDTLKLLNVDFRQYVQQPIKSSTLSPIPIESLASMLKHLPQLQALNESLLAELKQAKDRWPQTQKIAHVLVKIGPFLKHYSTYIRDFESIQQQLVDNMKKYPQFGDRVREFETSSRCQKLTVQHHLLKPIQRIPQYRLLLQQYLHHLKPDDVDYEDTVNALEVVSRVAEHANQAMNEGVNFAKLLALQAKIVGKQRDIVQPGRLFIKEGELMKVCRKQIQPRWFILLNDVVLYLTQIQSSDILYLNSEHPLDDCQVSTPDENKQLDSSSLASQYNENEFNVCTRTRSFALIAKSRGERDDWINTFKQTIDEHMARRRSFSVRQQQQFEHENPNQQIREVDSFSRSTSEIIGQQQQQTTLLGHKAPLWTPDSRATMCQLCTSSFSALFRRHHCRACGRVVCSACSSNKAPLIYLKCRAARVCDECFDILKANIHLYYLPNAPAEVGEPELRRLDEHFRTLLKSQFVRCRFAIYMRRGAKNSTK